MSPKRRTPIAESRLAQAQSRLQPPENRESVGRKLEDQGRRRLTSHAGVFTQGRMAPMDDRSRSEAVLEFWFGTLDEKGMPSEDKAATWWRKDPAFDERIRREFGADLERASRGELDDWKRTPKGRLALVILLDQFSRNAYRDTPRAFENDARALALAEEGVALGHDRELVGAGRSFLYMPFMHSEDPAVQNRGVEIFQRANEELGGMFAQGLDFARRHRDIVVRFGRFPHRNATLGRESTPEEVEFLEQPGSGF